MKRVKIAILVSIVLICGFGSVSLWVNLRERKISPGEEKLPKIGAEGANVRLEKIRFVEDKQGQKTWELEAKAIQQYQDQNIMMLEDLKVTLYTKDGKSVVISANQGKVYQDSKNVELIGDVLVTSNDGYRLRTHSASYRHSEKKILTSDLVEIEGDQIRLVGRGMSVDLEAKSFKVLDQVKTQWKGGRKG